MAIASSPSPVERRLRSLGGPTVRVFDEDPDLLQTSEPRLTAYLRHAAVAPRLVLEPGPWSPSPEPPGGIGLLVVDGLLTETLLVDGRCCPQLLGAGDLLRPWDYDGAGAVLDLESRWEVLEPTELAVLDRRFAAVVQRWPMALGALLTRSSRQQRNLALHLAIVHVPRAEQRLHLLLWHLADRWGRVTPHGIHLPLVLTHRLLAQLTCMRRPTATNALTRLTLAGAVGREPDGTWLLFGDPPAC